jgi:hypothetical protein
MGEIKSTLDIVMERTRHLTMTQEEKDDLRRKEVTGKVRGWIQKYLDEQLNAERLVTEMDSIDTDERQDIDHTMKAELIEQLQPDGDNIKVFELIDRFTDLETDRLKRVISEFQEMAAKERGDVARRMTHDLAQRGISGTAVVPNLELDAEWASSFQERLSRARDRLKGFRGTT